MRCANITIKETFHKVFYVLNYNTIGTFKANYN